MSLHLPPSRIQVREAEGTVEMEDVINFKLSSLKVWMGKPEKERKDPHGNFPPDSDSRHVTSEREN